MQVHMYIVYMTSVKCMVKFKELLRSCSIMSSSFEVGIWNKR